MKSLDSLIRLHQWRLDERRRGLAELQGLSDQLGNEIIRVEADLEREKAIAADTEAPAIDLVAYLQAMLTRRTHLQDSQRQVEKRVAAARDEMANAFAELKRFELAKAERDRRAAARQRRQEMARYDDIALTGYRRRKSAWPDA